MRSLRKHLPLSLRGAPVRPLSPPFPRAKARFEELRGSRPQADSIACRLSGQQQRSLGPRWQDLLVKEAILDEFERTVGQRARASTRSAGRAASAMCLSKPYTKADSCVGGSKG